MYQKLRPLENYLTCRYWPEERVFWAAFSTPVTFREYPSLFQFKNWSDNKTDLILPYFLLIWILLFWRSIKVWQLRVSLKQSKFLALHTLATTEYLLQFVYTIDPVKWLFYRVCQKRGKHRSTCFRLTETKFGMIWLFLKWKKVDSMLPCVSSVTNHRRRLSS